MKIAISWILRLIAAVILAQSVIYKFTSDDMSVEIFTKIGMEPEGRYLIGALELISVFLLILPNTVAAGALLACGIMTGAIIGHLTSIGVEGDHMTGFLLGLVIWLCTIVLMVLHRKQVPMLRHMFEK